MCRPWGCQEVGTDALDPAAVVRVGVFRLRMSCASRNSFLAQHDNGFSDYEMGGRRQPPHSFSTSAATASTNSSSHGRPTICTPIGRPSVVWLTGTTAPGLPIRLNHSA